MKRLLVVAVLAVTATAAWGGELAGVTMSDTVQIGDDSLVLNGMGLRTKMGFKVYVAGLYLPDKTGDAEEILGADTVRRTVMDFKRNVGAGKLCNGWKEGLEGNTSSPSAGVERSFETLCGYQDDMKKGGKMIYTYVPGKGTEVEVNGQSKGTIEGKEFADALFSCWLGPEPPSEDFKSGLLGQ